MLNRRYNNLIIFLLVAICITRLPTDYARVKEAFSMQRFDNIFTNTRKEWDIRIVTCRVV
jgi:hypothetical protein